MSAALRFDMLDQDGTGVNYSDEASLRGGFAALAWNHGWSVRQEVVIPKWGRLDLVLDHPRTGWAIPVEFKLDLDRPAMVRKAFAQADGYAKWLRENDAAVIAGPDAKVVLCAPGDSIDWVSVGEVGRLYLESVQFTTGGALIEKIRMTGDREWSGRSGATPIRERAAAVSGRLEWHRRRAEQLQGALDMLTERADAQQEMDDHEAEMAARFHAEAEQ